MDSSGRPNRFLDLIRERIWLRHLTYRMELDCTSSGSLTELGCTRDPSLLTIRATPSPTRNADSRRDCSLPVSVRAASGSWPSALQWRTKYTLIEYWITFISVVFATQLSLLSLRSKSPILNKIIAAKIRTYLRSSGTYFRASIVSDFEPRHVTKESEKDNSKSLPFGV